MSCRNALCFTDLSSNYADAPQALARPVEICSHHQHLFVREANKTCSFVLENPVLLMGEPEKKLPSNDITNDGINQSRSDNKLLNSVDDAKANAENKHLVAMASITSIAIQNISDSESKSQDTGHEIFLFGGLELVTSIKTIEVYVSRPMDDITSLKPKESYLTTCKGVPMRDLPPLAAPLISMGKSPEMGCDILTKNTDFFKFILVSPGGAKPVERVRLKFVGSDTISAECVIVRTLKVKGRLADTVPPSPASQMQTTSQLHLPNGDMNDSTSIRDKEKKDNVRELSGTIGVQAMATQQQGGRVQSPSYIQNNSQLLQLNHQQEKNQAEIMNAIAGLGIFLKHSEEQNMAKLDTMLNNMEVRIMERIDNIAVRLNAIEKIIVMVEKPNMIIEDADKIT